MSARVDDVATADRAAIDGSSVAVEESVVVAAAADVFAVVRVYIVAGSVFLKTLIWLELVKKLQRLQDLGILRTLSTLINSKTF